MSIDTLVKFLYGLPKIRAFKNYWVTLFPGAITELALSYMNTVPSVTIKPGGNHQFLVINT